MSIASAILAKQQQIADAYTAISGKGGTLPATQNLTNLLTAINSIPSGNVIGVPREISSGVYQMPTSSFTFSLPNEATDLGFKAIQYVFDECTSLTNIDLSNLTTISGASAMYGAFVKCTSLTNIDLSNLTTISGAFAMFGAFQECTSLTSIDLSNLTTISGASAMYGAFVKCTSLTNIDLSNLTTISGARAMFGAFQECTSLTTLYFPSLTSTGFGSNTNQFNNMLSDVTGCTVHFPSNLQSVIGSWSSVTSGFGGENTTVLFDLPATE